MSIVPDPNILRGKAVIGGTRIPVSLVLNLMANGYSVERIVEAYPHLTPESIRECLEYASLRLAGEEIYELPEAA
ncbi:MAG: DUF433 domain-containing protein [Caldilineaceae bacterium]